MVDAISNPFLQSLPVGMGANATELPGIFRALDVAAHLLRRELDEPDTVSRRNAERWVANGAWMNVRDSLEALLTRLPFPTYSRRMTGNWTFWARHCCERWRCRPKRRPSIKASDATVRKPPELWVPLTMRSGRVWRHGPADSPSLRSLRILA